METIKRILGVMLLALAFLFLFRVPANWKSTDPKANNKIIADIFLVIVTGGSALVLLSGSRKAD